MLTIADDSTGSVQSQIRHRTVWPLCLELGVENVDVRAGHQGYQTMVCAMCPGSLVTGTSSILNSRQDGHFSTASSTEVTRTLGCFVLVSN